MTSTEPCAMCLGAIPWPGVGHIATAAHDMDARAIGFEEGSKPDDWVKELELRGIKVRELERNNRPILGRVFVCLQ